MALSFWSPGLHWDYTCVSQMVERKLGTEPRAMCMLGIALPPEPQPTPPLYFNLERENARNCNMCYDPNTLELEAGG